jgi:hypothetical protein
MPLKVDPEKGYTNRDVIKMKWEKVRQIKTAGFLAFKKNIPLYFI